MCERLSSHDFEPVTCFFSHGFKALFLYVFFSLEFSDAGDWGHLRLQEVGGPENFLVFTLKNLKKVHIGIIYKM